MRVLDQIRQTYPSLTKSQKRLADHVAEHYQEVAFLTATRLAHLLNVNEATVVRFAQRLGYPGYPELAAAIQELVRSELQPSLEQTIAERPQAPLLALLDRQSTRIRQTISHITPEMAERAVAILDEAQRILVLGQGLAAPLAQWFALALNALGETAEAPPSDPPSLAGALRSLGERWAVVGLLIEAESSDISSALRLASQQGARTLALCGSLAMSTELNADVVLAWPAADPTALPTLAVAASLLDALIQALGVRRIEAVRQRAADTGRTLDALLSRRHTRP